MLRITLNIFYLFSLADSIHSRAQNLLISQSSYIIGEELSFDLVIPAEDSSAYVYMQLIDPWDMEIADFQVYLIGSRLMQGSMALAKQKLRTGPYLLTALSQKGSLLGIQTLHVQEGRHMEIYQALLSKLRGQVIEETIPSDFLEFTELRLDHNEGSLSFPHWEAMLDALAQGEQGFYNLHFTDSKGEKNQMVVPSAFHLRRTEPIAKEAYWISNPSDHAKEFNIYWYEQTLISFSLEARDSLELALESFPIGELRLSDGENEQIMRNTPSIESFPNRDLRLAFGEELEIPIPSIRNPLPSNGNLLIHAVVSTQPTSSKNFNLSPFAYGFFDEIEFAHARVEHLRPLDKSNQFLGFILMDSTSQIPFFLEASDTLIISHDMVYGFSRGEGRVRLARMNENLTVHVDYPELVSLSKKLKKFLFEELAKFDWPLIQLYELKSEREFAKWEVLDLEEVIIDELAFEDLEAELALNPFSIHWINTDFLCRFGLVLNCTDHGPGIGNHPLAVRKKIPLHIYLASEEGIAFQKGIRDVPRRVAEEISRNDGKTIRSGGIYGIPVSHQGTMRQGFIPSVPSTAYKWSPEPYLRNMEVVKFFNDDRFEGLREYNVVNVEDRQGHWRVYQENMSLTLRSQYARGRYFLHLSYLDLASNLHSTISIPFEVR